MAANVKFFRGSKPKYAENLSKAGASKNEVIYFATDTAEIIVNDISYGGGVTEFGVRTIDGVEVLHLELSNGTSKNIPVADLLPDEIAEMISGLCGSLVAEAELYRVSAKKATHIWDPTLNENKGGYRLITTGEVGTHIADNGSGETKYYLVTRLGVDATHVWDPTLNENKGGYRVAEETETAIFSRLYEKNFLEHEDVENKLSVRKMDADVTETTNRIYVAGGPLANSSLVSILPKDENNTAYIDAGTNIQDILLKLFTEVTFPDVTIKSKGSISTSISQPSYTFTYNDGSDSPAEANGKTVEVGTKVSVGAATLDDVTYKVTKRSSGTFTYGYSDSINSAIKGKNSNFEVDAITDSIGLVADETYTMSRDFTGFNNMADDSATASTTATAVTLDAKDCTVSLGDNKVEVSITGPRYECNFPELPSKYIVSNIGTKDSDEISPKLDATTTKIKQSNKPSNSREYTIKGAYYQFSCSLAKGVAEPSAPTDSSTKDFTKSFTAPTKYTLGNGTQLSKVIIYTTSTPTKVVYVNPANAAGGGADLMATPTMYQFTEEAISLNLPDGSQKKYNKIDIHALGGENFATGDPNTNYIEITY